MKNSINLFRGFGFSALMILLALTSVANAQITVPFNPNDRTCQLIAMLGGPLPAQCTEPDDDGAGLDQAVIDQLVQLQLAITPFYSFDVAAMAGWNVAISECVESPAGGMGFHIANIEQLENGNLNLLRPEVLLYAPTEDGSMELVGVEYIIPAPAWPHDDAPEFLGRELHFNPVQNIWALHVWIASHNPDGMFADFNPEVSCQFAM